jgi:large subunit ribosomal protein L5
MAKLKEKIKKEVSAKMAKKFKYKNVFEIPQAVKVVVSRGVSEATQNKKIIDVVAQELAEISGQKPAVVKAKKAIASFKLKQGDPIGCFVTLRDEKMYLFLSKLINVCLPRVRDFRGLNPNSFDGRGNYSFGLKEQLIFPEVDYDKVDRLRGMNITIHTTAKTDDEAKELLRCFGFPFKK